MKFLAEGAQVISWGPVHDTDPSLRYRAFEHEVRQLLEGKADVGRMNDLDLADAFQTGLSPEACARHEIRRQAMARHQGQYKRSAA